MVGCRRRPSRSTLRWIGWLDAEAADGLVARLWHVLGAVNQTITGKPGAATLGEPNLRLVLILAVSISVAAGMLGVLGRVFSCCRRHLSP